MHDKTVRELLTLCPNGFVVDHAARSLGCVRLRTTRLVELAAHPPGPGGCYLVVEPAGEPSRDPAVGRIDFGPSGQVTCQTPAGGQVAAEQEPAWLVVLRDKLARGVIGDDTLVALPYSNGKGEAAPGDPVPLRELRAAYHF